MSNYKIEIFKIYKYDIHPHISHIRGTNFIKRTLGKLADKSFDSINSDKVTNINEKEWDNLILLDACRHDIYEELYGETDSVYTPGSHSRGFIEKTFSDGDWQDTVVVTANPHYEDSTFEKATGRRLEDTFHEVFKTYNSGWDDELGTTPADEVLKDAKTAAKLFEEKKLIVHFMQPHNPYIGATKSKGGNFQKEELSKILNSVNSGSIQDENDMLQMIEIYKMNLKYVKRYVDRLEDVLEGKTVITADHGELLGEKNLFGHIYSINTEKLRKVPWDVRE